MKTKQNSCLGKVRHRDRMGAIIALKKINNHGLSGYYCRYCNGWHVGNNPKKIQLRLDQLLSPPPARRMPIADGCHDLKKSPSTPKRNAGDGDSAQSGLQRNGQLGQAGGGESSQNDRTEARHER